VNAFYKELKKLIEINSYTKNKKGVDKVADEFSSMLCAIGYELKTHQRELIGNHLHFTSKSSKNHQKILLLGHLDTVFPEGSFEGFREDSDWVYGAGVCDMKGGNLIAIEALRNIYKKYNSIENIDVLFVSDEETGSDDSKALSNELACDYDICLVFEAAGESGDIVVGRKGIGTFFIDIEGIASHSGVRFSDGIDANLEASHKLIKLANLTDLSKGTTLNVGKIEGGIGANTISPYCTLTFELRYTTTDERDRVLKEIDTIVNTSFIEGTKASMRGGIQRDVMQPNETQSKLVDTINKINKKDLPTEFRSGVSDANILSSKGVATIDGLGPYGDGDHTIKERASKQSFVDRIELVTNILDYHQTNKKLF
jgi:glutamate carboxypeptidase